MTSSSQQSETVRFTVTLIIEMSTDMAAAYAEEFDLTGPGGRIRKRAMADHIRVGACDDVNQGPIGDYAEVSTRP
jgi:hypothetical protein